MDTHTRCPNCGASLPVSGKINICEFCGAYIQREEETDDSPVAGGVILQTIAQFLSEDEWPFEQMSGKTVLKTAFKGRNGQWNVYAQERAEQEQVVVYSYYPEDIPPEKFPDMIELITRANYGMVIGNFEFDLSDGELRYKTSLDVENHVLSTRLVHHLMYANVATMDRYFPAFLRLISEGISPSQAIQEVEG